MAAVELRGTLSWDLGGETRARFDDARPYVLAATEGRHATRFSRTEQGGSVLWELGDAIAAELDLPRPAAAIAHRDSGIPLHKDVTNPYPCVNALVVYRHDCTGGELTIDDDGCVWSCGDGQLIVFDAQRPHEVSPVRVGKGGYRAGLVFYLPRG